MSTFRRNELARIKALVESEQEGILLVIGSKGAGKSRLLNAIEVDKTMAVHLVRINPAEASIPGAGLSAILAAFQSREAVLLSARLLSRPDGPPHVAVLAAELLSYFHTAERPPTVVLIDDVDLMDALSQAVLAMVAARLGGSGLRLIGTVSKLPSGPLHSLPHMKLAPLDFGGSMTLLSRLSNPKTDNAVSRMVVISSNGNPAALVHNFRSLTRKEQMGEAPISFPFRPPPHLADTSPTAYAGLPEGRDSILAQLSCSRLSSHDAITLGSGVIAHALDELLSDGSVVHTGRFLRIRDPLLRSQVYWSLSATNRVMYHRIAATAEEGLEPGLVAWHRSWLESVEVAPDDLLAAATQFCRQGFLAQAIEFAERACAIETGNLSADALFDLARAMFLRGELAFSRRYSRMAQSSTQAPVDLSAKFDILKSGTEFMASQQLTAAATDHGLVVRVNDDPDDTARKLVAVAIYHAERWEIDSAKESLEEARRGLKDGLSGEVVEAITLATMLIAAMEGDPGPTARMFDTVTQAGISQASVFTLLMLGRSLTFVDRNNEARRILRTIISQEPAHPPIWLESARYALAENEILAGNQFEALAAIDRLDGPSNGAQLHRNLHLVLMTWYWQARDESEDAAAAITRAERSLAGGENPALTARLLAYQGRFLLMRGRLDEAIAFLQRTSALAANLGVASLLRYQVDLIEALVLSGRLEEAAAEFQDFRARSAHHRTRWTLLATARANALVTQGEASIAAFQYAIKLWHDGDSQFELARTRLSFGDRLLGLGHVYESREQYLAARISFTQLGAVFWARNVNTRHPEPHEPVKENPLLARLTLDERRVASMVCRGMRNKEIAAELFVSLRTVEVRLTKIYHKLGARSRAHLTAMLTSDGYVDEETLSRTPS